MEHGTGEESGGSAGSGEALMRELARVGVDWAEAVRALAIALVRPREDSGRDVVLVLNWLTEVQGAKGP